MSESIIFLTIISIGLVTYAVRVSFILLLGKIELPHLVERALRLVPAAVLPALVVPALLYRNGLIDVSLGNERLISGVMAIVVVWYTRNVLLTIAVGMGTLWLLQAITA